MRATGIRLKDKTVPSDSLLNELCTDIMRRTVKAGFKTNTERLTGSAIKIGLHMSSFRVNTFKLGHNARMGRYIDSPKGYKLTDVPTWDQRVEFNNIVNKAFDKFGLIANIKSGPFTIRDKVKGAHDETDWENQTPSHMGYHGVSLNGMGEVHSEIVSESEARERCDSDKLEALHKERMKPIQREQAKERREKQRALANAKYVNVKLKSWGDDKRDGIYTQKRFQNLLAKLDAREKRHMTAVPANSKESFHVRLKNEIS